MSVRTVTFADGFRPERRGSPYYAHASSPLPSTGPYQAVDFVEIIAIVSGEGRRIAVEADGTKISTPLLPGQLYLLSPYETRELYSLSTPTMRKFNVAFATSTWEKFIDAAELDRSWAGLLRTRMVAIDVESPEIAEPFRRMGEGFRTGPTLLDLIGFLVSIVPFFAPAKPVAITGGPAWLRDVAVAMTAEEELRGGVERLVELAGVHPGYLWRALRRYSGLSPREFVTTIRMRHAATLLTTTDESVASISERCGFPDPSHFGQVFRRFHGSTPRDHRRRATTSAGVDPASPGLRGREGDAQLLELR